MGREIRMVPANWEHPKVLTPSYRTGYMEESYQPMFEQDVESAMEGWLEKYQMWIASERAAIQEKYPQYSYPADEPYRSFCNWHRKPPDPKYYQPKWEEGMVAVADGDPRRQGRRGSQGTARRYLRGTT